MRDVWAVLILLLVFFQIVHVVNPLCTPSSSSKKSPLPSSASSSSSKTSHSPTLLSFPTNFISKTMKPDPSFPLVTRFPPEPNGYLHLGHAKSILINFGLNRQHSHDGTLRTNVRFDDTNPIKESEEYARSIIDDVSWLVGPEYFDGSTTSTSQHFDYLEDCAKFLIKQSLAYVDKSDKETIRQMRGTLTQPGVPSPFRDTPPSENLELFEQMRLGSVPTGSMVLRLKIDMSSPNLNMRDPVAYRVLTETSHQNTGRQHNVYPMYDFSHPIVDALEKISHSLCTLEFEGHRPLYEWVLDKVSTVSDASP